MTTTASVYNLVETAMDLGIKNQVTITTAGGLTFVRETLNRAYRIKRSPKTKPSSEGQARYNRYQAAKRFALTVCENFEGGTFLTFTSDTAFGMTIEKFHKEVRKFLRNSRGYADRRNIQFNYAGVIGMGEQSGMLHLHLLVGKEWTNATEYLVDRWQYGTVDVTEIYSKSNEIGLFALGFYLGNQAVSLGKGKHQYIQSQNLKNPTSHRYELDPSSIYDRKQLEGFSIIPSASDMSVREDKCGYPVRQTIYSKDGSSVITAEDEVYLRGYFEGYADGHNVGYEDAKRDVADDVAQVSESAALCLVDANGAPALVPAGQKITLFRGRVFCGNNPIPLQATPFVLGNGLSIPVGADGVYWSECGQLRFHQPLQHLCASNVCGWDEVFDDETLIRSLGGIIYVFRGGTNYTLSGNLSVRFGEVKLPILSDGEFFSRKGVIYKRALHIQNL